MVMLLNDTSSEDVAIEELQRKLKKEAKFKRDIKKQLNDITRDVSLFYRRTGSLPNILLYKDDIRKVLRDNYRSIADEFKKSIRKSVGIKQDVDLEVDVLIAENIQQRSDKEAELIIDTTSKETDRIFEAAVVALAAQDIKDRNEIAKLASKDLMQRNDTRSQTIAETETQAMAEQSKDIEAIVLGTSAAVIAAGVTVKKVWNAILDGKTRTRHAFADGQKVNIGQAFTVGGEKLKFPGDTSLGASPGNVINCRCSVNYTAS